MKQKQNQLNGKRRQTTRHLLELCLLPLFMALVWAGCKQQAKVAADVNPVGAYALASVDGNKVPCTVQHEGHTLAVKSGAFIINPDGTCSSKMIFSVQPGGDATREVKATYTRQGSKLTMQWEGAGMTIGTVEGDSFIMDNEGMILTYRK